MRTHVEKPEILEKVNFVIWPNDTLVSFGTHPTLDMIFLDSSPVEVIMEIELYQRANSEIYSRRVICAHFRNGVKMGVKTLELYGHDRFEVSSYASVHMNSGCGFYRDGEPIFLADTLWKKHGFFGNK